MPAVTASTPDALWASHAVRQLRPAAVLCRGLRRRVRGVRLLDGADLAIHVGARVLVVSTPDASASLLLRILAGLSRADGGSVQLAGLGSRHDWGRRVAYVGAAPALPGWLSAAEALDLAARLRGYRREERRRLVDDAIERFALTGGLGPGRPMRHGGAALLQRVAYASAVIGEPEVLLLDEPLRAVDPQARTRLLTSVPPRTTLLLASRFPASEAGIVDQVALLRDGRVALHSPTGELDRHRLPLSLRGIEALGLVAGLRPTSPAASSTSRPVAS